MQCTKLATLHALTAGVGAGKFCLGICCVLCLCCGNQLCDAVYHCAVLFCAAAVIKLVTHAVLQVLVLQHLSGGEMLQQLQRVMRYTEAHACQLFRQV